MLSKRFLSSECLLINFSGNKCLFILHSLVLGPIPHQCPYDVPNDEIIAGLDTPPYTKSFLWLFFVAHRVGFSCYSIIIISVLFKEKTQNIRNVGLGSLHAASKYKIFNQIVRPYFSCNRLIILTITFNYKYKLAIIYFQTLFKLSKKQGKLILMHEKDQDNNLQSMGNFLQDVDNQNLKWLNQEELGR